MVCRLMCMLKSIRAFQEGGGVWYYASAPLDTELCIVRTVLALWKAGLDIDFDVFIDI